MRLALILTITVLAFASLYAPQPLLPLFAERLGLSESRAGLLVTASLVPLAVAPLSYGALLGRIAPVRLLRLSVLALGGTVLAFSLAGSFPLLLGIRFAQGLILPAVMTSLMTYIALSGPEEALSRRMSLYVAATTMGGYLGRLLSGLGAAYLGWRAFFYALGGGLLLGGLLLRGGPGEAPEEPSGAVRGRVLEVLRAGTNLRLYALVLCFFFVFSAFLNYLPFRLEELTGEESPALAGLLYSGFLVGIAASLGSGRIVDRVGGEGRVLIAGFAAYLGVLAASLVSSVVVLFGVVFLLCGAMFLMHAVAAGWVNRRVEAEKGIANGLYLTFYYSGAAAGTYLPGLVYERLAWTGLVGALAGVAALGLWLALDVSD